MELKTLGKQLIVIRDKVIKEHTAEGNSDKLQEELLNSIAIMSAEIAGAMIYEYEKFKSEND
ncbi:hypothetical protein [Clostridium estertheticum]|uniref:Uncharacterized protein n=1 Tax=Clostridium estertheticum subsp. estertheticum TaxID=1552 RepID=A0A1J0GJI7_9CLOT|nr:hypothetical protein [Clostridium estertheticum]APC41078.1 hypothetical protein A7L45_13840 [Clostridium estertheticum subsp. estertheticum]